MVLGNVRGMPGCRRTSHRIIARHCIAHSLAFPGPADTVLHLVYRWCVFILIFILMISLQLWLQWFWLLLYAALIIPFAPWQSIPMRFYRCADRTWARTWHLACLLPSRMEPTHYKLATYSIADTPLTAPVSAGAA